jgi:hypothetical protein
VISPATFLQTEGEFWRNERLSAQSWTGPGRVEGVDPIKRAFIIIVAAGFG